MKYSHIMLVFLSLIILSHCQVGRDIALQFLKLDTDNDYILSSKQLKHLFERKQFKQISGKYYNLPDFMNELYPSLFWQRFDIKKSGKLSASEIQQIVDKKWSLYGKSWEQFVNPLAYLNAQQILEICDNNGNHQLQQKQIPICLKAILTLEKEHYPWKIESMFYKNSNVGYDFQQFKKVIPKFKADKQQTQNYALKLFKMFEWDNEKIKTDKDQLIGPQQGKIMEPIIFMMFFDKDRDGKLSKQQAAMYLRRFGGEKVFKIMNTNLDDKVDKNEFVAYYTFAVHYNDSKDNNNNSNNSINKQQKKAKQEQQEITHQNNKVIQQVQDKQDDENNKQDVIQL